MEYPAMNSKIKEEDEGEEGGEEEVEEVEEEESEWGFVWRRSRRECGLVVEEVGQDSAGLWKVGRHIFGLKVNNEMAE